MSSSSSSSSASSAVSSSSAPSWSSTIISSLPSSYADLPSTLSSYSHPIAPSLLALIHPYVPEPHHDPRSVRRICARFVARRRLTVARQQQKEHDDEHQANPSSRHDTIDFDLVNVNIALAIEIAFEHRSDIDNLVTSNDVSRRLALESGELITVDRLQCEINNIERVARGEKPWPRCDETVSAENAFKNILWKKAQRTEAAASAAAASTASTPPAAQMSSQIVINNSPTIAIESTPVNVARVRATTTNSASVTSSLLSMMLAIIMCGMIMGDILIVDAQYSDVVEYHLVHTGNSSTDHGNHHPVMSSLDDTTSVAMSDHLARKQQSSDASSSFLASSSLAASSQSSKAWSTERIIYYYFPALEYPTWDGTSNISAELKKSIQAKHAVSTALKSAAAIWSDRTCVTFVLCEESEYTGLIKPHAVKITHNEGTLSSFCVRSDDQARIVEMVVGIKKSDGDKLEFYAIVGVVVHELGHVLNMYHAFQRSDRDMYVNVRTEEKKINLECVATFCFEPTERDRNSIHANEIYQQLTVDDNIYVGDNLAIWLNHVDQSPFWIDQAAYIYFKPQLPSSLSSSLPSVLSSSSSSSSSSPPSSSFSSMSPVEREFFVRNGIARMICVSTLGTSYEKKNAPQYDGYTTAYDYRSIMHYKFDACMTFAHPIQRGLPDDIDRVGNSGVPSALDYQAVCQHFKCGTLVQATGETRDGLTWQQERYFYSTATTFAQVKLELSRHIEATYNNPPTTPERRAAIALSIRTNGIVQSAAIGSQRMVVLELNAIPRYFEDHELIQLAQPVVGAHSTTIRIKFELKPTSSSASSASSSSTSPASSSSTSPASSSPTSPASSSSPTRPVVRASRQAIVIQLPPSPLLSSSLSSSTPVPSQPLAPPSPRAISAPRASSTSASAPTAPRVASPSSVSPSRWHAQIAEQRLRTIAAKKKRLQDMAIAAVAKYQRRDRGSDSMMPITKPVATQSTSTSYAASSNRASQQHLMELSSMISNKKNSAQQEIEI